MACLEHDWFLSSPCPRCTAVQAPAAPSPAALAPADAPAHTGDQQAAVADDPTPYEEPPLPPPSDDPLTIPPLFRRRKGGGFMYPSLHSASGAPRSAQPPTDVYAAMAQHVGSDLRQWSDDKLTRTSQDQSIPLTDRQPLYQEMRRRQDRKKAYDRLDKAGFTGAHKDTET